MPNLKALSGKILDFLPKMSKPSNGCNRTKFLATPFKFGDNSFLYNCWKFWLWYLWWFGIYQNSIWVLCPWFGKYTRFQSDCWARLNVLNRLWLKETTWPTPGALIRTRLIGRYFFQTPTLNSDIFAAPWPKSILCQGRQNICGHGDMSNHILGQSLENVLFLNVKPWKCPILKCCSHQV